MTEFDKLLKAEHKANMLAELARQKTLDALPNLLTTRVHLVNTQGNPIKVDSINLDLMFIAFSVYDKGVHEGFVVDINNIRISKIRMFDPDRGRATWAYRIGWNG